MWNAGDGERRMRQGSTGRVHKGDGEERGWQAMEARMRSARTVMSRWYTAAEAGVEFVKGSSERRGVVRRTELGVRTVAAASKTIRNGRIGRPVSFVRLLSERGRARLRYVTMQRSVPPTFSRICVWGTRTPILAASLGVSTTSSRPIVFFFLVAVCATSSPLQKECAQLSRHGQPHRLPTPSLLHRKPKRQR